MAMWMLFATVITALVAVAAVGVERIACALRLPSRGVWVAAMLLAVLWPLGTLLHLVGARSPVALAIAPAAAVARQANEVVAAASTWMMRLHLNAVLLAAWGLLSTLLLVRLIRHMRALSRWRNVWRSACVDGIPVRLSPDVGPAVVGLHPMVIVLPEWVLALDRPLLAMVLRHEEEHQRAGDPYLLFAASLLSVLMPWNLSLWWIARRLRIAIELDCDARVLRAYPRPERYGLLLLTMAQRRAQSVIALAPAMAEPTSSLERRIRAMRMVQGQLSRLSFLTSGTVAVVAITAAFAIPTPDRAAGHRNISADAAAMSSRGRALFASQADKSAIPMPGNPAPRYPRALDRASMEGTVVTQFVVNTSGRVEMSTFKVLQAADPRLTAAILRVLPAWRFHPAEARGEKVRQLVQMPFAFRASQ